MFELHYPDGRTEFELPQVWWKGHRLASRHLLDVYRRNGRTNDLWAMMVKMLAYAVWQEHSEAVKARGRIRLC